MAQSSTELLHSLGLTSSHEKASTVRQAWSHYKIYMDGMHKTARAMSRIRDQKPEDWELDFEMQQGALKKHIEQANQSLETIKTISGAYLPTLSADDMQYPEIVQLVRKLQMPMTVDDLQQKLADAKNEAESILQQWLTFTGHRSIPEATDVLQGSHAPYRVLSFGRATAYRLADDGDECHKDPALALVRSLDEALSDLYTIQASCGEIIRGEQGTAGSQRQSDQELAPLWKTIVETLTKINACHLAQEITERSLAELDYDTEEAGAAAMKVFEAVEGVSAQLAAYRESIAGGIAQALAKVPWLEGKDITNPDTSFALQYVSGVPDPLAIATARQALCKSQYSDNKEMDGVIEATIRAVNPMPQSESMAFMAQTLSRARARLALDKLAESAKAWAYDPENAEALWSLTGLTSDDVRSVELEWIGMDKATAEERIERCVSVLASVPTDAVEILTSSKGTSV